MPEKKQSSEVRGDQKLGLLAGSSTDDLCAVHQIVLRVRIAGMGTLELRLIDTEAAEGTEQGAQVYCGPDSYLSSRLLASRDRH